MQVDEFRQQLGSGVDDLTEDLAVACIGAAIEVHRVIGSGLPELVYKRALSHELTLRGISHVVECPVPVVYKGQEVGLGRIDIFVANRVVLELKTVEAFTDIHKAQTLAYLQALHLPLGILLNFHTTLMRNGIKRVINTFHHFS